MQNYLLLKHRGGYILGLVTRPDPSVDPMSAGHWDLNNLCIIAALRTHSTSEENGFLCNHTNTYLVWNALKSRHEQVRPIAQILLIQQALAVCYQRSEHLSTTSTQLGELVRRIYAIGIPKEDDFLTIMMLNAMAEDLPHVRNHIADALTTSTSTTSYGPSNIRSCLDVEQQLIDMEKSKSGDIVMAAMARGAMLNTVTVSHVVLAATRATHPRTVSLKEEPWKVNGTRCWRANILREKLGGHWQVIRQPPHLSRRQPPGNLVAFTMTLVVEHTYLTASHTKLYTWRLPRNQLTLIHL
jgi:hypothetical protein